MLALLMVSCVVSVIAELVSVPGGGSGVGNVLDIFYLVFQIALLLSFVLYAIDLLSRRWSGRTVRKGDLTAILVLFLISAIGVAVRLICSVQVELFFEAISLFGCMVLLEPARKTSGRKAENRLPAGASVAIVFAILVVIAVNVTLILNLSRAQNDELGNTQLDVIRSDLQVSVHSQFQKCLYCQSRLDDRS